MPCGHFAVIKIERDNLRKSLRWEARWSHNNRLEIEHD